MTPTTLKSCFAIVFVSLFGLALPALADTPPHKNAPPSDSVKPEKPRPELAKSDTQSPTASAPNASANPQDTAPAAKRQFVKPSKEKPPHGDQNTRHKH